MEALRIISDEHQALAGILHAIRFMLKKVSAGELQPDLKLFEAMVHYLDAFAEKRHHPKEDLLFAYLKRRTDEGADALHQLGQQHAAAPQRIATLQQALAGFAADPSRLAVLAASFEAYAEFYRTHMLLEEDVLLPLANRHLTAQDWAAVDREFESEVQDHSGKDGQIEDFSALFSRLVECAPQPIGLGAHPYGA